MEEERGACEDEMWIGPRGLAEAEKAESVGMPVSKLCFVCVGKLNQLNTMLTGKEEEVQVRALGNTNETIPLPPANSQEWQNMIDKSVKHNEEHLRKKQKEEEHGEESD